MGTWKRHTYYELEGTGLEIHQQQTSDYWVVHDARKFDCALSDEASFEVAQQIAERIASQRRALIEEGRRRYNDG